MANIQVSQYAGSNNWALLLDNDGFIAEGSGDNFFIVKDGKIITPEGRNILRGVSRAYIFELATQLGLVCKEKNIEPYDVLNADEAFMTGTPFCMLPVASLNGQQIGDKPMGEVTRLLLDTWGDNVGLNIEEQIKMYSQETAKPKISPYQFNHTDQ